jgi:hypothetical protein
VGLFYGCTVGLTAYNGGFWPGQNGEGAFLDRYIILVGGPSRGWEPQKLGPKKYLIRKIPMENISWAYI